ncbi:MAG: T9SS type A sorting domain-containing protein [Ignavibacteria bacterium]|jgi:hypothetical protein|nr:T9SS type A sorting domain-containing protein [Ignavibacteria bacterium]
MKKILLLSALLLMFSDFSFAQNLSAVTCDPPVPVSYSPDWGNDYIISNTEPMGMPSGVYRSGDNKLFVCIPDTNFSAGKGIVCLVSTNNGANWAMSSYITPAFNCRKTDVVITGDSVYCFFIFGTTVYCWNVNTSSLNAFTTYTDVWDFDADASSTGALYLIVDLHTSNQVRFFGSTTFGASWAGAVYLSSSAANPRWRKTLYGDTLLITYYAITTGLSDTLTAGVRTVRYRETTPGTLAITGSFATPVAAGSPKPQFLGVIDGSNAWLFYSQGTTGNLDFYCMVSTNMGVSFGTPFTIVNPPGRDEYWFDARAYKLSSGGCDLIFYSDSLQGGAPTNNSDKILYSYAPNSAPSTFALPVQISQNPPGWSSHGYIPGIIEYYNPTGDLGAMWVGISGSTKKLYYDKYLLTGIKEKKEPVPASYSLSQNYPNPFNPATKIDFSIPQNAFVTVKVYDILGKEVSVLVNKYMIRGTYSIDFNGENLTSGVYFYKITSGSFTDTKKMMLLK